ncbi:hypothetical protein ANO14919_071900 [Xylariales sp. No.14919]|nr:hypothetical protein ANO14919_071900 [Xylariales sp. No.14919]
MTTSHGILFVLGLLGSADLENLIGATYIGSVAGSDSFLISTAERLEEQTFNIREPGLNVDYMTYTMLSPVNNNHSALLEIETLEEAAQRTFSVFFQHLVNNEISMTSGGYVYQSPDEKLTADIGKPYAGNFPNTTTLVLSISELAAWICISILGYLIITCVLLAIASQRYNRLLLRQVNSISDIAFLVAGSHRLLNIAGERTLESIKHDDTVRAKLDWFITDQGDHRWGIEVVGEPDLNLPPTGPIPEANSFPNSGEGGDVEDEGSWHDAVVSEIMAVGR